jgi:hypothetical protein
MHDAREPHDIAGHDGDLGVHEHTRQGTVGGGGPERLFTPSTVTSRLAAVGAKGFRRLRSAHPDAIVQCPVDFLEPLVLAAPRRARAVLRMLAGWRISRFSVAWAQDTSLSLVQALQGWGYDINLYGVPDHESFLHAVLLLPRSLTADFNSRSGTMRGGARVNDGGTTATGHPSRLRRHEDPEPCATAPRFSGLSDAPPGRAWEARLR